MAAGGLAYDKTPRPARAICYQQTITGVINRDSNAFALSSGLIVDRFDHIAERFDRWRSEIHRESGTSLVGDNDRSLANAIPLVHGWKRNIFTKVGQIKIGSI